MINSINSFKNDFTTQKNEANEKLASGKRINSAKDDAAGLIIAQRLTAQINGNSQYVSNSLDAVNLISTSDSVLESLNTDATRIQELTIQSGSGINSQADIDAIQSEIDGLTSNISDTINNSEFNSQPIFNNEFKFSISESGVVDISTPANGNLSIDLSDPAQALDYISEFINDIGSERSTLGAQANVLESNVNNLLTTNENQSSARSRIEDTDYAKQSTNKSINEVLENINTLIQKKENTEKGNLLNLIA
jgi:flagellin